MAKLVFNKKEKDQIKKTRKILRDEYLKYKAIQETYQRIITLKNGHILSFIYYEGTNIYGSYSLKIVDMNGKLIKQYDCKLQIIN